MAFTSNILHAGSDQSHGVELQVRSTVRQLRLYDRPGDDMSPHKGDLWELNIADFHFLDPCISIRKIRGVSIVERSNDGWNIASIATFVKDSHDQVQVLTQDIGVNRWIDGNSLRRYRRFELTFA